MRGALIWVWFQTQRTQTHICDPSDARQERAVGSCQKIAGVEIPGSSPRTSSELRFKHGIKSSSTKAAATIGPYEELDRVVLNTLQVPLRRQERVRPTEQKAHISWPSLGYGSGRWIL